MNATTHTENNALATLPPAARAALALGSSKTELALRELVKASAGILEVKNKAGREECHAAYMKLKNSRVAVDHTEADATEDAKKFTKAVKTEAARLVSIISAEEKRLLELRDAYDKAEQDRKDAEVAAEMARVALIAEHIEDIRKIPLSVAGKSSTDIQTALDQVSEIAITEAIFGEQNYRDQAAAVRADALAMLESMLADRIAAETAEVQRLADIAEQDRRRAEEAAELSRQRAENERIAAENAAAAKKLADQQAALELAARQQREQADEKARAEQVERDRIAAEQQAKRDAELAEIAAQRQALADERAAEDKRRADALAAAEKEKADTAALGASIYFAAMPDAEFDALVGGRDLSPIEQAAYEAEGATRFAKLHGSSRVRQEAAEQFVKPVAPAPVAAPLAALADAYAEPELTSFEIARFVIEAVTVEFKINEAEAIARLRDIDFSAYAQHAEAA